MIMLEWEEEIRGNEQGDKRRRESWKRVLNDAQISKLIQLLE